MNVKVALTWALRLGLGGLFIAAGVLKLRDPLGFATAIANYQLFPQLAGVLAATLPTTEVLVGAALVASPRPWRGAAALGVALMMLLFTVAATVALVRGIDISCGCFGSEGGRISGLTIARDLGLLAAAAALLGLERGPGLSRPAASSAH
jgi:uncharacterized membrane protein YphA (DoxX/SURF4 family)